MVDADILKLIELVRTWQVAELECNDVALPARDASLNLHKAETALKNFRIDVLRKRLGL